jgi:thiamine biosynthesis protein ThiS
MKIFVNDDVHDIPAESSLHSFLTNIGMSDLSGWAIALNEEVIPSDHIKEKILFDGDRLLFVQATQGG